mmetsp:Transcript_84453/g.154565  ORF Transcript_84453/g.154565 Transcript_84453/m.154565 type:complete len:91 (-) Transcript_84453:37-309(-)
MTLVTGVRCASSWTKRNSPHILPYCLERSSSKDNTLINNTWMRSRLTGSCTLHALSYCMLSIDCGELENKQHVSAGRNKAYIAEVSSPRA